jgi:glycosyltransferase involved in cell wall biosynthesis
LRGTIERMELDERSPRASILIPSFNHAAFVVETVESALAQSERDVEVLVIDDGSTDDSLARLARLADPRLHVSAQANAGLSRTLNRALERARGRWVKFLPSDDVLEPGCIERELAAAEAAPGTGVVFALPLVVDAAGVPFPDPAPQAWFDTAARGRDDILRELLERNFLCAPSALFERERALAVGGFDPQLVVAQDYDLWLKILADAGAVLLPERLVRVRWHGANQSARVTEATEAERARVVVAALERMGLERWIELFREPGAAAGTESDRRARLALAAALERSGLAAVVPWVRRLTAEADASLRNEHASRALGARFRAVAALLGRRRAPATARAPHIPPGPRVEHWVVAGETGSPAAPSRGERLASALAAAGAVVTWLPRPAPAARGPEQTPAGSAPPTMAWSVAALRALFRDRDERLRLVLQQADGEAVAIAREARLRGVRVLFDKTGGAVARGRAELDTERALVDAADDLIGAARPLVKQLAVHRRPVHLLLDAEDEAGWHRLAASLREVASRPTVAVIVVCAGDLAVDELVPRLDALSAARERMPYRLIVVDDGVTADLLEDLDVRAERGDVVLLRNPRRGRAAARNLALRATASELVVLLDARHGVPDADWLATGVARLLGRRSLAAVVVRAPAGAPWAWLAARAALARVPGFDEAYDPGSAEDEDLERQLRALGYEVEAWPQPAPDATRVREAPPDLMRRAARRFRGKWRAALQGAR